ncbi:fumarylacetoacetate hydrolase family protein [Agrococcus lahaulensis]|uniref:fumarylacetoacetate hydrolase family protein n=1 Tax=Agrococcus lahaulensis TaxID=341722 RepID=UPI00047E3E52|nr:fumarylacetoacetate hydrolase family protein [Agrococcus lahaulensis]
MGPPGSPGGPSASAAAPLAGAASRTSPDDVFSVADLIAFCSSIVRLRPRQAIATGPPGGVGHGMHPPRHLQPDQLLETELGGVETLRNRIR